MSVVWDESSLCLTCSRRITVGDIVSPVPPVEKLSREQVSHAASQERQLCSTMVWVICLTIG